jgi:hypothetical protein
MCLQNFCIRFKSEIANPQTAKKRVLLQIANPQIPKKIESSQIANLRIAIFAEALLN